MNKFQEAERKERYWLNHLTKKHNMWVVKKIYEDDYNSFDCTLTIDFLTLLTEIKVRTFQVDRYDQAILEKAKVDKILNIVNEYKDKYEAQGKNIASSYLAVYPLSKVALLFNLAAYTGQGVIDMPRTTMGNREMVPTPVYYYKLNTAKQLEL